MTDASHEGEEFGWVFPNLRRKGAGQGGDLTQFTMEGELETFVREILQNSNDAALLESDEPVEVTFRIKEHTGEDLQEFKDAIGWTEWRKQVDSASEDNQIAERINQFAEDVEEEGALRTLVVEDKNTKGLVGPDEDKPERGSTNFSALVRDSLESNKDSESAGGKFGLGKAVLRIFSGASMVLFNSVLSEPDPVPLSPRLIGRTRLPQHWKDETRHNGQGFFGDQSDAEDDFEPPNSVWGDDAATLAESLKIDRDDETPGTSIMVVGFRDPVREERREIEDLAEEIRDEAVKWFWPAIERDDLKVRVTTDSNTYDGTVSSVRSIQPFVECLGVEEATENLEVEGDVAFETLDVDIPDATDGTEMPDDGEVELGVRLTTDDSHNYSNHVALVRGSGMVVKYWNRNKLVHGNRHFHSVALAGEARAWCVDEEPTTEDTLVERFLKDAEPPTHDDWKQTSATREDYKQGTKKAIDQLHDDIEGEITSFVGPNFDRGVKGPQLLANRFPISNQGKQNGPTTANKVDGRTNVQYDAADSRWEFEGTLEPARTEYELVSVEISLRRMGEERQTNDYIPIHHFTEIPDGCRPRTSGDSYTQKISVTDDVSELHFEGVSDVDLRGTKTKLNVDATVRVADDVTEVSD